MVSDLEAIRREIRGLEKALALKPLKGSVIMELVRCGKPSCHACTHGPYAYLHFWDSSIQKSRRKYLGTKGLEYYASPKREIIERIRDLRREESEALGEAQTQETEGKDCRRCRNFATQEDRPFCEWQQAFLMPETFAQPCDGVKVKLNLKRKRQKNGLVTEKRLPQALRKTGLYLEKSCCKPFEKRAQEG